MLKIILMIGFFFNTITTFAQWSQVADSINNIKTILTRDSEVFCGTLGTIYYSPDNGNSWWDKSQGLKEWSSVVDFASNDTIMIIGCSGDGVYISTNNGNTWIEKDNGLNTKNVKNVIVYKNLLFAGEDYNPITLEQGGLYVSSDKGDTWDIVNGIPPGNVYELYIDNNNIYTGLSDGLYFSTDGGTSWLKIFDHFVNAIEKIDNYIFVGSGDSICVSANNGLTWQKKVTGLDMEYVGDFAVLDSIIFVSEMSQNRKIFASTDLGNNWYSIYSNLPTTNNVISNISATQNYLFLSMNSGNLWRRPINTITYLESESSESPNNFTLFQNYPNPFNPTTTISYSIPKTSLVKILIYDALGREIKTLLDEVKSSGIHKIEFNANDFCSGVYFYRIQANSFIETKKLILIK
jgi:photosystem II stability/assembly factor-like uncharacterized protein